MHLLFLSSDSNYLIGICHVCVTWVSFLATAASLKILRALHISIYTGLIKLQETDTKPCHVAAECKLKRINLGWTLSIKVDYRPYDIFWMRAQFNSDFARNKEIESWKLPTNFCQRPRKWWSELLRFLYKRYLHAVKVNFSLSNKADID